MSANSEKIELFIAGKPVPPTTGKYFTDLHPEDDSVWKYVAEANMDDVNKAVLSAYATWNQVYRDTLPSDRETWLKNVAGIIQRNEELLAQDISYESGVPISQARMEVQSALDYVRSVVAKVRMMNNQTQMSDFSDRVVMNVREPLGVCASITSSHKPFFHAVKMSLPVLMSGNTLVSLSSELTPQAGINLAMIYQEAGFPDGAYNQLSGLGAEVGDFLTMHPMVKAILFQGSSGTGKRISKICGMQMKPCILALGSQHSSFISRDANLEQAVEAVPLFNSRIVCDEKIYHAFVQLLTQRVEHICEHLMGDLNVESTCLGSILSDEKRDTVRAHIADAIKKGANVVAGGHWQVNRCQPTVLTEVTPEMKVCRAETFGPVMTLYKARGFDEALSLVNDVEFCAASSIWTTNIDEAMEYSRRSESVSTFINTDCTLSGEQEEAGSSEVNLRTDTFMASIEKLTSLKSVTIQLPAGFDSQMQKVG